MTADLPVQDLIAQVLLDEGAAPGSGLHSWRCEYPDVYGPCTCVADTAAEIVAAIQGATTRQQAELLGVEMDVTSTGRARLIGPWREGPA